jgi:hypothetical protein
MPIALTYFWQRQTTLRVGEAKYHDFGRLLHGVGQDDGVALGEAAWAVAYLLRDLSSARQLIDRALELNPNLASAWAISGSPGRDILTWRLSTLVVPNGSTPDR